MSLKTAVLLRSHAACTLRKYSTHYKFVVAGGGAGGCAAAANLSHLGSTAIIDPADVCADFIIHINSFRSSFYTDIQLLHV